MTIKEAASEFLAKKRIAVTVSLIAPGSVTVRWLLPSTLMSGG